MISPENFKILIESEHVEDLGPHVSMRIAIYDADDNFFAHHSITLRSVFYHQVRQMPDGDAQIKKIARSRCRDEINRRLQGAAGGIEFPLKLESEKPE